MTFCTFVNVIHSVLKVYQIYPTMVIRKEFILYL